MAQPMAQPFCAIIIGCPKVKAMAQSARHRRFSVGASMAQHRFYPTGNRGR
jgi:hypothetical protein